MVDASQCWGPWKRWSAEDGFTIVEAVVALVIVAVLFFGVATSLGVALRHQREVRLQQQAAALAVEHVEFARSVQWAQLELSVGPGTGGPYHDTVEIDAAAFGLATNEDLVIDETGSDGYVGYIDPSDSLPEMIDGQEFDVFRYVTDAGPSLRRVLVLVQWEVAAGSDREHLLTTVVSEVGAG